MDMTSIDAAFRLPASPYPGLRPFLDHEAALLLGRVRQVAEVIERLNETHFVAVIGGSGSGKSSLVRAGVVRELRGFGIPDAGDYWIPIICTPGTTAPMPDKIDDETPITRLAWKFSQVLEASHKIVQRRNGGARKPDLAETGADVAAAAAVRRAEIATVFRQSGFSRLIDNFTPELPRLGPVPENARFLFVIDQFEELFHHNNADKPDARQLIEAIIDHFFDPHPRCYVVLTMRSERLTDCAGFLELPDAINKSSYLVRRLDDNELRDAIVGPAQYFLRLLQRRGTMDGKPLPDEIIFDEAVVERLLTDVKQITSDADHLALLQHLLARIWNAACERERLAAPQQAPAMITWADLERAVHPRAVREAGWLREMTDVNTLRSSLENCAQAVYDELGPADRERMDAVLRRLGFKDPNSSLYTQQRLIVDSATLFEGVEHPATQLRELLEERYLGNVNYLFWDDENPDNVTLKVSHESFIRGWLHFRSLVDFEASRFHEFVAVLGKCAQWTEYKGEEHLLQASDQLRFKTYDLAPVFQFFDLRSEWFRMLEQHHDGARLSKFEPMINAFLLASRKLQQQEKASKRQLRVLGWCLLITVTALVGIIVQKEISRATNKIQAAGMMSATSYGIARAITEKNAAPPGSTQDERQTSSRLDELLRAARNIDAGNQAASGLSGGLSATVDDLLPVMDSTRFALALVNSEPMVNGSLRSLLTSGLWRSPIASKSPPEDVISAPADPQACKSAGIPGTVIHDKTAKRGIFIPTMPDKNDDLRLLVAKFNGDGECMIGRPVWSVPGKLRPQILFDARARFMAVALDGASGPMVMQFLIKWDQVDDPEKIEAKTVSISTSNDPRLVDTIRKAVDSAPNGQAMGVASVASWREVGGMGMNIGSDAWHLVNDGAQRIDAPGPTENWRELGTQVGAECGAIDEQIRPRGSGRNASFEMYQDANFCYSIMRSSAAYEGNSPNGAIAKHETIVVNIFRIPLLKLLQEVGTPSPVASFIAFDNLADKGTWVVGSKGEFDGWIAHRRGEANHTYGYYGMPWTTNALVKVGNRLQENMGPIEKSPSARRQLR